MVSSFSFLFIFKFIIHKNDAVLKNLVSLCKVFPIVQYHPKYHMTTYNCTVTLIILLFFFKSCKISKTLYIKISSHIFNYLKQVKKVMVIKCNCFFWHRILVTNLTIYFPNSWMWKLIEYFSLTYWSYSNKFSVNKNTKYYFLRCPTLTTASCFTGTTQAPPQWPWPLSAPRGGWGGLAAPRHSTVPDRFTSTINN